MDLRCDSIALLEFMEVERENLDSPDEPDEFTSVAPRLEWSPRGSNGVTSRVLDMN